MLHHIFDNSRGHTAEVGRFFYGSTAAVQQQTIHRLLFWRHTLRFFLTAFILLRQADHLYGDVFGFLPHIFRQKHSLLIDQPRHCTVILIDLQFFLQKSQRYRLFLTAQIC